MRHILYNWHLNMDEWRSRMEDPKRFMEIMKAKMPELAAILEAGKEVECRELTLLLLSTFREVHGVSVYGQEESGLITGVLVEADVFDYDCQLTRRKGWMVLAKAKADRRYYPEELERGENLAWQIQNVLNDIPKDEAQCPHCKMGRDPYYDGEWSE